MHRWAVAWLAGGVLVLGTVLGFLAVKEAEREQLLWEKERQAQQVQATGFVVERAHAVQAEIEGRMSRMAGSLAPKADAAQLCRNVAAGDSLIAEMFVIGDQGQVAFPLVQPVYRIDTDTRPTAAARTPHPKLAEAETLEFQKHDWAAAAAVYESILRDPRAPELKGEMLNRIARCRLRAGRAEDAAGAYRQITQSHARELSEDGIPLGFLARSQLAALDLSAGRTGPALESYLALLADLNEGAWPMAEEPSQGFVDLISEKITSLLADGRNSGMKTAAASRFVALTEATKERPRRTAACAVIRTSLAPALRQELAGRRVHAGEFLRFSRSIGDQLYFGTCLRLANDQGIALVLNHPLFARKALPPPSAAGSGRQPFSIDIADASGNVLAGSGAHANDRAAFSRSLEPPLPP